MQHLDKGGDIPTVGAPSSANLAFAPEGAPTLTPLMGAAPGGIETPSALTGRAEILPSTRTDCLRLADLFSEEGADVLCGQGFSRSRREAVAEVLLDRYEMASAQCASMRFSTVSGQQLCLGVTGGYQLQTPSAGGWLLVPGTSEGDSYWIPQPPVLRKLDKDGHIQSHRKAVVTGFDISAAGLFITLEALAGHVLDLVVWRIPSEDSDLLGSLRQFDALERQRYFLWSSHTAYERPADLYLHLVHGHVYENHEVWPKYWRVCSELDAYAIYVTLSGLLRATGKRLYDLLRIQVVFSVIARQSGDGGWYHGEWTDQMESHYRLHAGAMHMLAAYFGETRDPVVGAALGKAAAFAASRTDRLEAGMWYLHDSLEQSPETLKKYPFRYARSRALGKSPSNLLVLNTHLDTNIAMERYRRATGDGRYDDLIVSARAATRAALDPRPAEWLYRPLYKAIGLILLPTEKARALPLHLRAIKRIAWKYLVPLLPRLKAFFPRLVMPGGFIERGLAQYGLSVRYQPVNLMDLIRTRRLFNEAALDGLMEKSFAYIQECGIRARWKELKGKEDDSLGFWAEALYHLSLASSDVRYRAWLAEAMLDLEDNRLGLSPSLLGANSEAVARDGQRPCPSPADNRIRVANLCREDRIELLVVNPSNQTIALEWETPPADPMVWQGPDAAPPQKSGRAPDIPPRGWLLGVGNNSSAPRS